MKLDGPYPLWSAVASAVSGGVFADGLLTRCKFATAILIELWDSTTGGTTANIANIDIYTAAGLLSTYAVNNGGLYGWQCDRSEITGQSWRNGAVLRVVAQDNLPFLFSVMKFVMTKNATTDTFTLNGQAYYQRSVDAVSNESTTP